MAKETSIKWKRIDFSPKYSKQVNNIINKNKWD